MKKHNYWLDSICLTKIQARGIHLCFFIVSMLSSPLCVIAQKSDVFVAGYKEIPIKVFDKEIDQMINEIGIPGLSLAIINNNEIVYSKAYGKKRLGDNTPVDDGTVFEAASLTKSFLVYVAHKMVDEGLLELDKPMYEYLAYEPLEHDSRYKLITPHMILSHSSGIENWRRDNNEDKLEILSTPGEKFVYSGEGFHYLAKVIESILQKPYEQYVDQMIIQPFGLQNTYIRFDTINSIPSNFAVGYDFFGNEVEKWKNINAVPASGNNLNAKDFAKLVIQTFNGKNLSKDRIADITSGEVKMVPGNPSSLYLGAGYMINYMEQDTLVSFAGSNDGYKAWVSYSVVNKRGFVFFTNSEIGISILKRLNEISVNLPIDPLLSLLQFPQYPSDLFPLLKVYNNKTPKEMFLKISELDHKKESGIDFSVLNMLSSIIQKKDKLTAKSLMQENTKLHPDNAAAFYNLAQFSMNMSEYQLAYDNFKKCKELNGDYGDLDKKLMFCREKLNN